MMSEGAKVSNYKSLLQKRQHIHGFVYEKQSSRLVDRRPEVACMAKYEREMQIFQITKTTFAHKFNT